MSPGVVEFAAVLLALAAALLTPVQKPGFIEKRSLLTNPGFWRRAARSRRWAVVGIGVLALSVQVTVGVTIGIPRPAVHDEFSHLLMADTFVEGRLTNPTHPLWPHFESYHIIHRPSYQSKYPPAQGLVLAAGQVIFGQPIAGVWLSVAAACAATCWMLQGWLPARWALLGGILAAFHYGVGTAWGQSYWGGGVAMLGGALLYGALPRFTRRASPVQAVVLAAGLLLLFWSRPYEGLLVALPALGSLGIATARGQSPLRRSVMAWAFPLVVVLVAGMAWTGWYHARVTGSAFYWPYQAWLEQYRPDRGVMYSLLGGLSSPSLLAHARAGDAASGDRNSHGAVAWTDASLPQVHDPLTHAPWRKLLRQWRFYATPALVPALLLAPALLRRRRLRILLAAGLLVLVAVLLEGEPGFPHYSAPAAAIFFAVVTAGFRVLAQWKWQGRRSGRMLAAVLPAVYVASCLAALAVEWRARPYPAGHAWSLDRARIARELEQHPGRHLVIVRYEADHWPPFEWVYNRADIDDARIVWARDLGFERNRTLVDYFPDRHVWLLEADSIREPRPATDQTLADDDARPRTPTDEHD